MSEFRLLGLGRSTVSPGDPYPKLTAPKLYGHSWRAGRTLAEYQVVLLSNAAGEFESEATGRVRMLGDVLLFLQPGAWHRYRPLLGGGWTERWLAIHGEAASRVFDHSGVGVGNPVYSPGEPSRLAVLFDELIARTARSAFVSDGSLQMALTLVREAVQQATGHLTELDRCATESTGMRQPEPEVEDPIVRRALEIIWNHEHCPPLSVSDVARMLPVTRRTLDRRFADVLGRTVLDEITACRLCRAKRLLAETDVPIKAVAYRAGFPSRERLRLAFLAHEGMPPSEYRESITLRPAEE